MSETDSNIAETFKSMFTVTETCAFTLYFHIIAFTLYCCIIAAEHFFLQQINPAATGNSSLPPPVPTPVDETSRRHQEEIYIAGARYVEWLKVKYAFSLCILDIVLILENCLCPGLKQSINDILLLI